MNIYKLILLSISVGFGYQYLLSMLINKGLDRFIIKYLLRKPFTCALCLSMWTAGILSLTLNIELIYYIVPIGIMSEAIARHLQTNLF